MRSATPVTAPFRSQSNLLPDGPVHLSIRGRVQGVGFRDALCDRAVDLGVQGWVRNRRDGSVEALIRGERRAVEALMRWAGHGPPAARVDRLDSRPARPEEAATLEPGFRRLPTE